jgi:hypothetical protein
MTSHRPLHVTASSIALRQLKCSLLHTNYNHIYPSTSSKAKIMSIQSSQMFYTTSKQQTACIIITIVVAACATYTCIHPYFQARPSNSDEPSSQAATLMLNLSRAFLLVIYALALYKLSTAIGHYSSEDIMNEIESAPSSDPVISSQEDEPDLFDLVHWWNTVKYIFHPFLAKPLRLFLKTCISVWNCIKMKL